MWKKGNTIFMLMKMQIGKATMENTMESPQKIKNKTTIQPINSTLGYFPE